MSKTKEYQLQMTQEIITMLKDSELKDLNILGVVVTSNHLILLQIIFIKEVTYFGYQ